MKITNIIIYLALSFLIILSFISFRELNLLKKNIENEFEVIKSQLMDLDSDIHSLEDD